VSLYETTFILDPELKDDGWEAAVGKYSGIITQNGAIKNVYRWGLRRLAYEIEKQSHGYYVHIIHESGASVPHDLERQFKLDESCLRYMTVLADNPKYLEEMEKNSSQQSADSDSDSSDHASAARGSSRDRDADDDGDSGSDDAEERNEK